MQRLSGFHWRYNCILGHLVASQTQHGVSLPKKSGGSWHKFHACLSDSAMDTTLSLNRPLSMNADNKGSVQFSSVAQSCPTLCDPMNRSTSGLPVHHQLWELVMPCSHLILCRPLLLLPPIRLSIRVFSNESTLCMRWPKYWSFSFSISPSNEYPGLNPLGCTGWISLQSKRLSRVFSNTTVQMHQFFGAQPSSQPIGIDKSVLVT